MEPGTLPGAIGAVWSTGTGWSGRVTGKAFEVVPGTCVDLQRGVVLRVQAMVALQSGSTVGDAAHVDPPVKVVMRHDTVHLFRPDRPPMVLSGIPARIVSEVGLLGAPAPWEIVAAEIWRSGASHKRRQNWDRTLRRLRKKLRQGGVRSDLVRADGRGNVELYLLPGDELVDQM